MSVNNPSIWGKFQILLALSSFIANLITGVTLYFALSTDGNIGQNSAIVFLSIVNLCLVITAYVSMRNHQKDHQAYSNAHLKVADLEKNVECLEGAIKDLKLDRKVTANIVHNFCHEYRSVIAYLSGDALENMTPEYYLEVKSSFQKFFLFALPNIKELFDSLTEDSCAVCIKIIDEDLNVRTFRRDPVSYRARRESDSVLDIFPYKGNTAFANIMNSSIPDTSFLSNDLKLDSEYVNMNTRWKKMYNATMVVPIRIPYNANTVARSSVIGFLCVDNSKGGFDSQVCLNLLSAFGDMLFHLFHLYGKLDMPSEETV